MTMTLRHLSTILMAQTLVLTVACNNPKIDGSTDQSCVASIAEVTKHAFGRTDSAQYASIMVSSVGALAFSGLGEAFASIGSLFDDQGPSVEMPKPDSLLFQRSLCDALNGMTADDIVAAQADSVTQRVKNSYQRRYATLQ